MGKSNIFFFYEVKLFLKNLSESGPKYQQVQTQVSGVGKEHIDYVKKSPSTSPAPHRRNETTNSAVS